MDTGESRLKALVVYYSRSGNTRKIARELAAALGADIEELNDGKKRRGPVGFISSGFEAMKKRHVKLALLQHSPADYDLVLVGSPIWANSICSPVRTFLAQHKRELKQVAWFCTSGSVETKYAEEGFAAMEEESSLTPIATLGLGWQQIRKDHAAATAVFVASLRTAG